PQPVVRSREAVEGNTDRAQAGSSGTLDELACQPPAAGGDAGLDAELAELSNDDGEVRAQVRFTSDQRHLLHVELGELPHEIETLARAELVRSRSPRARAAVAAGKITGEGDLPHAIDGSHFVRARNLLGKRQMTPRRRGQRSPGAAG